MLVSVSVSVCSGCGGGGGVVLQLFLQTVIHNITAAAGDIIRGLQKVTNTRDIVWKIGRKVLSAPWNEDKPLAVLQQSRTENRKIRHLSSVEETRKHCEVLPHRCDGNERDLR